MRLFKQKVQKEERPRGVIDGTVLPVHMRLAIFARQSTVRQTREHIDSKEYQTEDLLEIATRDWGWNEQDIDIIDRDLGVSGQKRIEQRPGMSQLLRAIKAGKYGAVLVSAVDRLFRDRLGVQSGRFLEAVEEHGVLVLTPDRAYNPQRYEDLRALRTKLGEAADYVNETLQVALDRRKRAAKEGRYDGRAVPVGFLVDRTDKKNKRYIEYEPHACVVRWLFKRYRELESIQAILRELAQLPYVFPGFEAGMKPEKITLDRKGAGYGLGRDGLISILTNPAYIGTWVLREKGEVIAVIPHNHPAIVDVDAFYFAFRRLSPTDVDGTPFRQEKRPARHEPAPDRELAAATSLLKDVITSPDGPVYPVTAQWGAHNGSERQVVFCYATSDASAGLDFRAYKNYIRMDWLDMLFSDRLVDIVAQWASREDAGQTMYEALKAEREDSQQALMDIDEQLAGYHKVVANIDAFIEAAASRTDAKTLQQYAAKRAEANANIAALERQRGEASVLAADVEECEDLLDCVCKNWQGMGLEKQRRFIRLVVRGVCVSIPAPHFVRMQIDWRRPYIDSEVGLFFKRGGSAPKWTEEELAVLERLYEQADRGAILQTFPKRSWNSIKLQAEKLGIVRRNTVPYPLHPALSLADWELMQQAGYMNPHEEPVLWYAAYPNEREPRCKPGLN